MALVSTYNDPPVIERTFADFNAYHGGQRDFWNEVDELRFTHRGGVSVTWDCPVFNDSVDSGDDVSSHRDFMESLRDAAMTMGSDTLHQYFSGSMEGSSVTFRVYVGADVSHRVTRPEDVRYR